MWKILIGYGPFNNDNMFKGRFQFCSALLHLTMLNVVTMARLTYKSCCEEKCLYLLLNRTTF